MLLYTLIMTQDKAKKVDLHIQISQELSEKLRTLEYYSAKNKTFIVSRAIELLRSDDLEENVEIKTTYIDPRRKGGVIK